MLFLFPLSTPQGFILFNCKFNQLTYFMLHIAYWCSYLFWYRIGWLDKWIRIDWGWDASSHSWNSQLPSLLYHAMCQLVDVLLQGRGCYIGVTHIAIDCMGWSPSERTIKANHIAKELPALMMHCWDAYIMPVNLRSQMLQMMLYFETQEWVCRLQYGFRTPVPFLR